MEWFFIIGGIVIWLIWKNNKKQKQQQAIQAAAAKIAAIPNLTSRITREDIVLDDGPTIDSFKIELKGWIMSNPNANANSGYWAVYMYDDTDGKKLFVDSFPLLSTVQSWAEEGSTVLRWKSEAIQVSSDTYYPDWTPLLNIPYAVMDAPYKGKRKISFVTYFCRSQAVFKHGTIKPEDILGSAETVKEINFDGIGWKETTENKPRVMELSLELALLVANADGSIDDVEIEKIKAWVKTQVSYDEEIAKKEKENLSKYLEEAYSAAKNRLLDKIKVTNELNEKATTSQKYQAIELMLDVMVSDDSAEGEEQKLIDEVVPLLNLDTQTYKDLRDTRLSTVKTIETGKEGNDESLFHLTPDMSDSEKCNKLQEEYNLYAGRLDLQDKQMSLRAKEMCDRILKLRKKYNCS